MVRRKPWGATPLDAPSDFLGLLRLYAQAAAIGSFGTIEAQQRHTAITGLAIVQLLVILPGCPPRCLFRFVVRDDGNIPRRQEYDAILVWHDFPLMAISVCGSIISRGTRLYTQCVSR